MQSAILTVFVAMMAVIQISPTWCLSLPSQDIRQGRSNSSSSSFFGSLLSNFWDAPKAVLEQDLTDDLELWEAPSYITKEIPYYLSGYDPKNRPIWVFKYGKIDLRSIVERGDQAQEELIQYTKQATYRFLKSIRAQNVTDAAFLMDFEGQQLRQMLYLPNVAFVVRLANMFSEIVNQIGGSILVVNTNYVAEQVISIVRPLFGPVMERVEVFGSNRRRWVPRAQKMFGPESIAESYGGTKKNFKPVAVYN